MKFLLFLFLIASFVCKGQSDTVRVVDGRLVYDVSGNLIGYETGNLIEGQYHKLPSMEEKLLQYAQECWNDSTQEEHPTHIFAGHTPTCEYREGFSNGKLSCINPSHYARKVAHRKPTFEGFIEWLKKQ